MSVAMLSAMALICADAAAQAAFAPAALAQAAADPAVPPETGSGVAEPAADAIVLEGEPVSDPLAFEGESDDQIVARLIAYLEGLTTINGNFTQIAPSGAISTGRFYLRRPGLMRFEYDPPTPLLIVANGGVVYVRDDALETTDSYPVGRTPLKFLLRKTIARDDLNIVAVDRGVDTVAVTLASGGDETEGELTVIVTAPEMTLARWIVRDVQNGITVVTLENVQTGDRLANRLFEIPEAGGLFLQD